MGSSSMTFSAPILDADDESLTLIAGAGDITFSVGADIGSGANRFGAVTIESANDVSVQNITATSVTVGLTDSVNTFAAGVGTTINVNTANGNGYALDVVAQEGGTDNDDIVLQDVDSNGVDVRLRANDEIVLNGTVSSTGGGATTDIFLMGLTAGNTIGVGDTAVASDLFLSEGSLANVAASFGGGIHIGENSTAGTGNQTGSIDVDESGGLLGILTTLTLHADAASIDIGSDIDLQNGGDFIINGANATTTITGNVTIFTDDGSMIDINDSIAIQDGFTLTLNSDQDDNGVGGLIDVSGNIQGDGGGNEHLVVDSGDGNVVLGTDGDNVINGSGGDARLGNLTIDSTASVTIHGAVTGRSIVIGGSRVPMTVNINDPLDLSATGDVDVLLITATDVNFAADAMVTTAAMNDVVLTGTGSNSDLVIPTGANFDLGGDLVVDNFDGTGGAPGVQLGANVTADEGITFQNGSNIALTDNVILDTDDSGGANVTL